MTSDELHQVATIAKAEALIELFWAHLYDTEMHYHNDGGAQGYMGGMIRMVLDQMDGLMDEMVDKEEVHDDAPRCRTCRYYYGGVCNNWDSDARGVSMEPHHYCDKHEVKPHEEEQ